MHRLLFVCLFFSLFGAAKLQADVVRFGYNQNHFAPIVIRDDNFIAVSGIIFDLANVIANEAGYMPKLFSIPRKRIEQYLVDGKVDAKCHSNPVWYTHPSIVWSPVVYQDSDVIVTKKHYESIEHLAATPPFKIGTVLGYKYPELDDYFKRGEIKRFDSTSSNGSFARFIRGELDGFVSAYTEANYLTQLDRFHVININENNIYCAFSPKLDKEKLQKLLNAITRLKAQGEFQRVLAKYIKSS